MFKIVNVDGEPEETQQHHGENPSLQQEEAKSAADAAQVLNSETDIPVFSSNQDNASPPRPITANQSKFFASSHHDKSCNSSSSSDSEDGNPDHLDVGHDKNEESQERIFDNMLKEQDQKLEKQLNEMIEQLKQNTFEIQNLYKTIGERQWRKPLRIIIYEECL